MLCHLGGAIPYLAERLDRGFDAFKDCRANIDQPPSTYLRQFYYDTVNFDVNALNLAIAFAGADHILAGSDYPHQIGSIPSMLDAIGKLPSRNRIVPAFWAATPRGCCRSRSPENQINRSAVDFLWFEFDDDVAQRLRADIDDFVRHRLVEVNVVRAPDS